MIKILIFGVSFFILSKFISKFFRENKIHRLITKYFDFIFISNLPYFFILLMIFCWGMSLAYYSNETHGYSYFSFTFNYKDIGFFIGFLILMFAINIRTRLDNLVILKEWGEDSNDIYNQKYKTNLNHLYTSPNFISPNLANKFFKVYFIIGGLLILVLEPKCLPLLLVYSLFNFFLHHKFIKTLSFNIFVLRCFFTLAMLFLLFSSGWLYFGGNNVIDLFNYFPLFLMAVLPIILIYEIFSYENLTVDESNNRQFIIRNKKTISLAALLIMILLFYCSFFVYKDPILSHFSIITIPFLLYACFRSQKKDFFRSFTYPIMVINILLSWTLFPLLFIVQFFIYYISKYYFWHRFENHFPTFLVEDSE